MRRGLLSRRSLAGTAVDLAYSCSPFSDGPEPPGGITIQPAAASTAGNLYRTIPFSVRPQDHFSVEYVVRCITGATCRGRLGWQGRGLNAVDPHVSPKFTIPNDGRYYLCRFDSNHGAAGGAIRSNTKLRVRLFNVESATQLRIDAMALYGYVGYHAGFDDNPTDVKFCNAL